ncbi:MAG: ribonuclease Y [Bacillota bacterium]|nr:ribonuclease Y [Bacillota bacterium]
MGLNALVALLVGLLAGGGATYLWARRLSTSLVRQAEREAARIREEAAKEKEQILLQGRLQAEEESRSLIRQAQQEAQSWRAEVQKVETRLEQREEGLERRARQLDRREEEVEKRAGEVEALRAEAERLHQQQMAELERIAGLTRQQAREELMAEVRQAAERDAALLAREIEEEARGRAEREAREVIAQAIQRCAADYVAESTVSVVPIPSDDMKGRIIGREGRNIRAFEAIAGVDLIVDDTPEAVVVSAFEPVRREKARLALEMLVADGRIHPARIEEIYQKAEREIEQEIQEAGEEACLEVGVHGLHGELVRTLGRLKFRTSYGQNVLRHSVEVAHLAGMMASMLGANVAVAKRAGLLHDIGKAVDREMEGTHVMLGMELLRRYHESEEVIHAMSTHHGEFEALSVEAVLVTAADALSAARPGARRETLEAYIQRLTKLEEIASSFKGVEKSYAIQAGREIRIIVKPDEVDDLASWTMAKEIARRIEKEMQYPGQIKVTVIRESRAVEYAR